MNNMREGMALKKRFWLNLILFMMTFLAIQIYIDNNVIPYSYGLIGNYGDPMNLWGEKREGE